MKHTFHAIVWQEGEVYVAQCLDIDISSYGETGEKSLQNLREALELYFEPPVATDIPRPPIYPIEVELNAAQTAAVS